MMRQKYVSVTFRNIVNNAEPSPGFQNPQIIFPHNEEGAMGHKEATDMGNKKVGTFEKFVWCIILFCYSHAHAKTQCKKLKSSVLLCNQSLIKCLNYAVQTLTLLYLFSQIQIFKPFYKNENA